MLNSIPVGALGRIVPLPLGHPIPTNVAGNSTVPTPASGANVDPQNPDVLNAQAGVNLPPLRQNDTPPAPAPPGTAAPANGPIPAGPQPQNALPHFANLFGAFPPGFHNGPPPQRDGNAPPHPSFMPRVPRERKAWTLPPAPGPSLRQRIERREREAGLRCYDVSCGVGPSDEDPLIALTEAAMKQLEIRPHGSSNIDGPPVCRHTFHSPCLVSSERVSLKGGEVNVVGDNVEVSCSICRGVGCVSKADWDEGVQALA
ncbi:hypothetical protein BDZ94DRAFT_1254215 [Collybia nuda]|uniref:Uncharacterized protein n=1 Tax=Collybia nuda TaxID=64659 RepID=A0A9P6CGI7_9AGAR|nr:hypothetical protein BDZ94DRAFT_1254215 [Collybia nuda]